MKAEVQLLGLNGKLAEAQAEGERSKLTASVGVVRELHTTLKNFLAQGEQGYFWSRAANEKAALASRVMVSGRGLRNVPPTQPST